MVDRCERHQKALSGGDRIARDLEDGNSTENSDREKALPSKPSDWLAMPPEGLLRGSGDGWLIVRLSYTFARNSTSYCNYRTTTRRKEFQCFLIWISTRG
jgi:hypothetical protein